MGLQLSFGLSPIKWPALKVVGQKKDRKKSSYQAGEIEFPNFQQRIV